MLFQVFKHMFQKWPVDNRNHGLGRMQSEGTKPRPLTADKNDCLHLVTTSCRRLSGMALLIL
jgi:hypothetical protein